MLRAPLGKKIRLYTLDGEKATGIDLYETPKHLDNGAARWVTTVRSRSLGIWPAGYSIVSVHPTLLSALKAAKDIEFKCKREGRPREIYVSTPAHLQFVNNRILEERANEST